MPSTKQSKYEDIRPFIKPGDVVAFVGRKGLFSWAIRVFTGRPTHVAPVAWIESDTVPRVVLVEALEGKGVVWSYLRERIKDYDGEVYLMRLDPNFRFDSVKSADYLRNMIGTPYSMLGAIAAAPGQWLRIAGKSVFNAVFCSKLAWFALSQGGLMKVWIGDDETPSPYQIRKLPVWAEVIQIHGEPKEL